MSDTVQSERTRAILEKLTEKQRMAIWAAAKIGAENPDYSPIDDLEPEVVKILDDLVTVLEDLGAHAGPLWR